MTHTTILALILAGGEGNRMDVLTTVRAKPALPFAGVYRLIDFPLSNCVHSAIADVWIIEQFQPHSLNEHLVNGRPWDLDRTYGGLRLLQPFKGTNEGGWHQGNADALYRNRHLIRQFEPDVLLVLSADHVYKLDYRTVIDAHLAQNAHVTMVTTQVARAEASRFGNVRVENNKVTRFAYKPDEPISDIVTTEVFVYNPQVILAKLEQIGAEAEGDESGLKDFGDELLPQLVEAGHAYAFPLDGYWRDVGTIASYWQAHMDLLQATPPLALDEPKWPILTLGAARLPAHIHASARIENSLIAAGCEVRGQVIDSVLAPGVIVAEGAVVRNSIIFNDTVIAANAEISYAIVDSQVAIGERARIGGTPDIDNLDQGITLIGERAQIAAAAQIAMGSRIQPTS